MRLRSLLRDRAVLQGGGPIAFALVSGEIQVTAVGLGNMIGQLQSGQLKALAAFSERAHDSGSGTGNELQR
jgi:putative tricarboxylic transport membrane protein